MHNGWSKSGRNKLHKFLRLAARGARMRRLRRAAMPHALCLDAMAARARLATARKGAPPVAQRAPALPPVELARNRARKVLARQPYRNDAAQRDLLDRLPTREVSLLRTFITMGKRVRALTGGGK
jgi:hypothetical protein